MSQDNKEQFHDGLSLQTIINRFGCDQGGGVLLSRKKLFICIPYRDFLKYTIFLFGSFETVYANDNNRTR